MGKIQLHRAGIGITASAAELEDLSREFQQKHAIVLEGVVEPGVMAQVQDAVAHAEFIERRHEADGQQLRLELCMTSRSLAVHMLMLLANSTPLLGLVQGISGGPRLDSFAGRVYRFPPSPQFFDEWHTDLGDGRQVGMSINLGSEPYEGGVLEIRDEGMPARRLPNTIGGNAILFKIREGLQHRVTAVTGSVPKTAFAGWFFEKGYRTPYLEMVSSGSATSRSKTGASVRTSATALPRA